MLSQLIFFFCLLRWWVPNRRDRKLFALGALSNNIADQSPRFKIKPKQIQFFFVSGFYFIFNVFELLLLLKHDCTKQKYWRNLTTLQRGFCFIISFIFMFKERTESTLALSETDQKARKSMTVHTHSVPLAANKLHAWPISTLWSIGLLSTLLGAFYERQL